MNEEEKKAIEFMEYYKDVVYKIPFKTILNLIEKQQKEIQRLEKDNDTLSELVIVNEDKVINELDLISKDKIREKIKEVSNGTYDAKIILEKLLEE